MTSDQVVRNCQLHIYRNGKKILVLAGKHESLANFWGEDKFRHPQCVTENILKTTEQELGDGGSMVTVQAHGYKTMPHMYYDKVWGGDGRLHTVPVEWFEYLPVVGTGSIYMNEDTDNDTDLSPEQRQSHILNRLCEVGGRGVYRRHIASHI